MRERVMPQFLAYSATNTSFGSAWRNMVMEPPRRELKHLVRLGIQRGELSPAVDAELALVLLLGPLVYWHAFMRKTSEDPSRLAEAVVDAFWGAFGTKRANQTGRRISVSPRVAAKAIQPTKQSRPRSVPARPL